MCGHASGLEAVLVQVVCFGSDLTGAETDPESAEQTCELAEHCDKIQPLLISSDPNSSYSALRSHGLSRYCCHGNVAESARMKKAQVHL